MVLPGAHHQAPLGEVLAARSERLGEASASPRGPEFLPDRSPAWASCESVTESHQIRVAEPVAAELPVCLQAHSVKTEGEFVIAAGAWAPAEESANRRLGAAQKQSGPGSPESSKVAAASEPRSSRRGKAGRSERRASAGLRPA